MMTMMVGRAVHILIRVKKEDEEKRMMMMMMMMMMVF
jgi:hypothetical protein